jgi:hypothetical protein
VDPSDAERRLQRSTAWSPGQKILNDTGARVPEHTADGMIQFGGGCLRQAPPTGYTPPESARGMMHSMDWQTIAAVATTLGVIVAIAGLIVSGQLTRRGQEQEKRLRAEQRRPPV